MYRYTGARASAIAPTDLVLRRQTKPASGKSLGLIVSYHCAVKTETSSSEAQRHNDVIIISSSSSQWRI